jgi:hypothetical protein
LKLYHLITIYLVYKLPTFQDENHEDDCAQRAASQEVCGL